MQAEIASSPNLISVHGFFPLKQVDFVTALRYSMIRERVAGPPDFHIYLYELCMMDLAV